MIIRRRHTFLLAACLALFTLWYLTHDHSGKETTFSSPVVSAPDAKGATKGQKPLVPPKAVKAGQDDGGEPTSSTKAKSGAKAGSAKGEADANEEDATEPDAEAEASEKKPPKAAKKKPAASKPERPVVNSDDFGPSRWEQVHQTFGSRKFTAKHTPQGLEEFKYSAQKLPQMQVKEWPVETTSQKEKRVERQQAVKAAFVRTWDAYKKYAWMKDELTPVTKKSFQKFGNWAATLVDSLDTLWMMGMKDEFEEAVKAVDKIDFTQAEDKTLNVFEMTIRYLGGFLGAYDISGGKYPELLEKAKQVGDLLYCAFDTPNHMPVTRWDWKEALEGAKQQASANTLAAELGSLTPEFTRLAQLTGDNKYYDAVVRIMREFQSSQHGTRLPGLWPTLINAEKLEFQHNDFTMGGMADSLYEYLPKQYALLGGRTNGIEYKSMYENAIVTAMNNLFFQPMLPDGADILIAGRVHVESEAGVDEKDRRVQLDPRGEHLGCFTGGMVAMGAKLFNHPEHMFMARRLVDGCIYAYKKMPTGVAPEIFEMIPCEMNSECEWDEEKWAKRVLERAKKEDEKREQEKKELKEKGEKIETGEEEEEEKPLQEQSTAAQAEAVGIPAKGFINLLDPHYGLRPEAIESVFLLYRMTGDEDLPESAWQMFQSVLDSCETDIAYSAIADVNPREKSGGRPKTFKLDSMESFWTAETLKYFYLIFSEPDLVNLDEYILTTEAHPLKRPEPGKSLVQN